MAVAITESIVYEALGRIAHPGVTHRSIVGLGMVADVEIRGGQVRVVFEGVVGSIIERHGDRARGERVMSEEAGR